MQCGGRGVVRRYAVGLIWPLPFYLSSRDGAREPGCSAGERGCCEHGAAEGGCDKAGTHQAAETWGRGLAGSMQGQSVGAGDAEVGAVSVFLSTPCQH